MSPEERAVALLAKTFVFNEPEDDPELLKDVTAAIREAENDALERAATMVEIHSPIKGRANAERIRALKH